MTAAPAELARSRLAELLSAEAAARASEADAWRDGYLDLAPEGVESTGTTQSLMLTRAVPAIYERWWRPALGRAFKGLGGPGMAEELRIARLFLGLSGGERVLDLACGPGNFSRRFARITGQDGFVVGLDASPTMLAKGVAEARAEGSRTSSSSAATPRPCPCATAAWTACAASRPCTSSRSRSEPSTRCAGCSGRAGGSRS